MFGTFRVLSRTSFARHATSCAQYSRSSSRFCSLHSLMAYKPSRSMEDAKHSKTHQNAHTRVRGMKGIGAVHWVMEHVCSVFVCKSRASPSSQVVPIHCSARLGCLDPHVLPRQVGVRLGARRVMRLMIVGLNLATERHIPNRWLHGNERLEEDAPRGCRVA